MRISPPSSTLVCLLLISACGDGGGAPSAAGASQTDAGQEPSTTHHQASSDAAMRDGHSDAGLAQDASAVDPYPPDADNDLDGLSNATEQHLGTDPDYLDTDGDGLPDAVEVGKDPQHPKDQDGDGFADALESTFVDNDRDGQGDQTDPAAANSLQIVFARMTPSVIANDGVDATRIELQLTGTEATHVSIGMDRNWWFPLLAPDQLELDGRALGYDRVDLFDDGTHGDRIAGDRVFTRGGITTQMKPRALPGELTTARGEVIFGSIEVTQKDGVQTRQIGYTDGSDSSTFPGQFWVRFVEQSELQKVEKLGPTLQRTEHVINLVDAELEAYSIAILNDTDEADTFDPARFAQALLPHVSKQADFLYVYPARANYGTLEGVHLTVNSDVQGIGQGAVHLPGTGGLQGVQIMRHDKESPLHHETMHQWGVYLNPSFGFDGSHWGAAGTYGVLGGFRAESLVDHADGTYTIERFEFDGNDWLTTPYSAIELYLMGLVPAASVPSIPVLSSPTILSSTDTTVTVSATRRDVTIQDIVTTQGARVPASDVAQKNFESIFAIVSDRLLTPAELAYVDGRARAFEATRANDILSFSAATQGRGTMRTALAPK